MEPAGGSGIVWGPILCGCLFLCFRGLAGNLCFSSNERAVLSKEFGRPGQLALTIKGCGSFYGWAKGPDQRAAEELTRAGRS